MGTQVRLTSGKGGSGWLSGGVKGERPSGVSRFKDGVYSPGVWGGVGFFGDGVRLLSEVGVAGDRLK